MPHGVVKPSLSHLLDILSQFSLNELLIWNISALYTEMPDFDSISIELLDEPLFEVNEPIAEDDKDQ